MNPGWVGMVFKKRFLVPYNHSLKKTTFFFVLPLRRFGIEFPAILVYNNPSFPENLGSDHGMCGFSVARRGCDRGGEATIGTLI